MDYRFPIPGVDARFPGGGIDNYFDNGGRFIGGKDMRFEPPGIAAGPYTAPSGWRWAYVTENGVVVTENGSPVVELVRII